MTKIIGIDLGTTNSCLALVEGGAPKVIENSEGARTTPSTVAYTDEGILVGQPAKRQSVTNPEHTLYGIKRLLGRKFEDQAVQASLDKWPFKIMKAKNGDAWLKAQDRELAPPQISAEILKKMKKAASDYLDAEVTQAVITVPAYFDDAQRQATKDAGRIAGLEVKRIINEPTAAALAYGLDKKSKGSKLAVYDLGGGTFDISIIEAASVDNEQQFHVLATNGNTFLGGEDLDNTLMAYLMAEFKKDTGLDLAKDPLAMQRLKEAAEKAKIELGTSQQVDVNLPYITADSAGPKHMNMKLTRAKLEGLVEEMIDKTIEPCRQAIQDAKLTIDDIDEVILVGGQTRMPLVQKKVQEFFKREPRRDINPDEAVALGAAVQAAVLAGDVKDVLLLDVTPLSLGIETLGGVATPLIEKNTTIPVKKSQVFSTAEDSQPAVTIHVLQGERRRAQDNKSLGRFDLTDIPPAPRGTPQIDVSFDIDANGILHVAAKDKKTGKEQSIQIKASGGLDEKEVERMVKEAESHADEDAKFEQLVTTRNTGDALLNATRKSFDKHKDDLAEKERGAIEQAIKDLEQAIGGDDKEAIEQRIKELNTKSAPLTAMAAKRDSAQAADGAAASSKASAPDGADSVKDATFEQEQDDQPKDKDDAKPRDDQQQA